LVSVNSSGLRVQGVLKTERQRNKRVENNLKLKE
jgi:hypothetical protein